MKPLHPTITLALFAVALAACSGSDPVEPDSGPPNTHPPDADASDLGPPDDGGPVVAVLQDDGTIETVGCATIAAHRDTGALHCAPLGIQDIGAGYGNTDPRSTSVHPSAAGDVIYVSSANALGQNVVYELDMDGPDGPVGTLIGGAVGVNWVVVNATGDLLANFEPSAYDPTVYTRVYPVDGSDPYTVEGIGLLGDVGFWTFAIAGEAGAADEDTFYVLDAAEADTRPERVLHAVTRSDTSFVDTPYTLTLSDPGHCGFPHRLTGGIHVLCGAGLARLVEDRTVITAPALVPFTGVDRFLDVTGLPMRFAPRLVVLFATDGTTRKFLRHDRVTQKDIPLDADIELMGFGVSTGGDIDFLGAYLGTGEKVRGTVPAGATEVTILSVEGIDLAETVTFTRIN